jgi:hypothetical protein
VVVVLSCTLWIPSLRMQYLVFRPQKVTLAPGKEAISTDQPQEAQNVRVVVDVGYFKKPKEYIQKVKEEYIRAQFLGLQRNSLRPKMKQPKLQETLLKSSMNQ